MTEDGSRVEDYISHLVNSLGRPVSLEGLKVVVDCANGAAYVAAPAALEAQGAEVVRIHATPDGININENCGSTHMDSLRSRPWSPSRPTWASPWTVTRTAAWPWTRAGRIVDGDQILAILALALREAGRLKNDTVVATVMSNLGFVQAMQAAGITVEQTAGRRPLRAGGDEGGRVLPGRRAVRPRGDDRARDHRRRGADRAASDEPDGRDRASLADLASVMHRLPQVLINVPGVDKSRADTDAALLAAVAAAESDLGQSGRVLLRPSGTESLVRVMVEAATYETANEVATRLADVVKSSLSPCASSEPMRTNPDVGRLNDGSTTVVFSTAGAPVSRGDRVRRVGVSPHERGRSARAQKPCSSWGRLGSSPAASAMTAKMPNTTEMTR